MGFQNIAKIPKKFRPAATASASQSAREGNRQPEPANGQADRAALHVYKRPYFAQFDASFP
jgi:hypothetical protein